MTGSALASSLRLDANGSPARAGLDEEALHSWTPEGNPKKLPQKGGGLGHARSAPLLHAARSTQGLTWYPSNCSLASGSRQSCWRPLGATWRDWENASTRHGGTAADDKHKFVQGCIPHWTKEASVRGNGLLEHELTWAYYRMRRHEQHPLRQQMGEKLPGMHLGKEFNFWRDLRPPFFILRVRRVEPNGGTDSATLQSHADGELYRVTYECGIEYACEHELGAKGEGGFFDNRIHGDALVRFSHWFPQKRPLHIVSWGKPVFNWLPSGEEHENPVAVDPDVWMPIAEELGVRPDAPSMETCRALTRQANGRKAASDQRGVEVPELERLLLGPHASLPRLAAATHRRVEGQSPARTATEQRKRSHRMFTPAAGFVHYAG